MTQAALNSSDAKQTPPACAVEVDRGYPTFSAPAITLPLEGLDRAEADALMRAMEFLCVLIEFYGEAHVAGPACVTKSQEHDCAVAA